MYTSWWLIVCLMSDDVDGLSVGFGWAIFVTR